MHSSPGETPVLWGRGNDDVSLFKPIKETARTVLSPSDTRQNRLQATGQAGKTFFTLSDICEHPMVARNALYSDGGEAGPDIDGISELTLWKRNVKRELARRKNVPTSRVHVEVRREAGEVVFDATIH